MITQNTSYNLIVYLKLLADHITPAQNKTFNISISKNGTSFSSITRTTTELGNGLYSVSLLVEDSNTVGELIILASGAYIDNTVIVCNVVEPTNALTKTEFLALQ